MYEIFLEAQGYQVDDAIMYQDNQSSMLLEENGHGSSGKQTHHTNIWYFFMTDWIRHNDLKVVHCPTEIMLGDYFTEPLQGAWFHQFCDAPMNYIDLNCVAPTEPVAGDQGNHGRRLSPGPRAGPRTPHWHNECGWS